MKINELILHAHYLLLARHGKKTQADVAKLIGVKHRTYVEYLRGTNEPLGMAALLNLFSLLPERDIIDLIKKWKEMK